MKQTRVVAKAVLRRTDKNILLLRRSATDSRRPMQWDLPGGMIEQNEDFVAGLVREVYEEAGFKIKMGQLTLAHTLSQMTDQGNVCWLIFVAEIEDHQVTLSPEHDKYKWVSMQKALVEVLYDRQLQALNYINDNALFD